MSRNIIAVIEWILLYILKVFTCIVTRMQNKIFYSMISYIVHWWWHKNDILLKLWFIWLRSTSIAKTESKWSKADFIHELQECFTKKSCLASIFYMMHCWYHFCHLDAQLFRLFIGFLNNCIVKTQSIKSETVLLLSRVAV